MTVPTQLSRIQYMQFVLSRSRSIFPRSSSNALSSAIAIHRSSTDGAVTVHSRPYSQQQHSYSRTQYATDVGNEIGGMAAAAAGISLLAISSSSSSSSSSSQTTTLCESSTGPTDPEEDEGDGEPEIDPYDNLPEKDEPTHCSICLTYRQGPCRPYWRKVEACTKDGEKDRKEKEGDGADSKDGNGDEDDESSSPMSESTRCFKYMMPWIDCASKYRNLYTLIEMDTNYTGGIQELEATSRHFCWVPGQEPKIDWSNWQQSGTEEQQSGTEKEEEEEEEEEETADKVASKIKKKFNIDADADADTDTDVDAADLMNNVALWKTFDLDLGDPKLITVEAQVAPTINSGLGILECAYAVDQDNNVIGFAYGTKPSDLIKDDDDNKNEKDDNGDRNKTKAAENSDDETKEKGADNNDDTKGNEDGMVTLQIRIVASRTEKFTLAASYTHRIEGSESGNNNKPIALESHLYKSKPFDLADIPKVTTTEEKKD